MAGVNFGAFNNPYSPKAVSLKSAPLAKAVSTQATTQRAKYDSMGDLFSDFDKFPVGKSYHTVMIKMPDGHYKEIYVMVTKEKNQYGGYTTTVSDINGNGSYYPDGSYHK